MKFKDALLNANSDYTHKVDLTVRYLASLPVINSLNKGVAAIDLDTGTTYSVHQMQKRLKRLREQTSHIKSVRAVWWSYIFLRCD